MFSTGSRIRTGQVSMTEPEGMRWVVKTPRPEESLSIRSEQHLGWYGVAYLSADYSINIIRQTVLSRLCRCHTPQPSRLVQIHNLGCIEYMGRNEQNIKIEEKNHRAEI